MSDQLLSADPTADPAIAKSLDAMESAPVSLAAHMTPQAFIDNQRAVLDQGNIKPATALSRVGNAGHIHSASDILPYLMPMTAGVSVGGRLVGDVAGPVAGTAMKGAGRAIETVANSAPAKYTSAAGAFWRMMEGHPLEAAAAAAAQPVLRKTGGYLQSIGDWLRTVPPEVKPFYSAQDVMQIQGLMKQGVPQDVAIATVAKFRQAGSVPFGMRP